LIDNPGRFSVHLPEAGLFLELLRLLARKLTDFLGMQSEVTRFHVAMFANDHIKHDHARFFTFDPISGIEERCTAMLTDPSHTTKFSKDNAIAIRRTVPFGKRKYLEV
jgi:hypothetical protein